MIELRADPTPTHETAGLPGFPAVDVFGSPREMVRAHFWGVVTRISGRPPAAGGRPGGAYGRSLYITKRTTGTVRYLTHLDELAVETGDAVYPGLVVATVCDSAVSGKPNTTHVHYGRREGRVVAL